MLRGEKNKKLKMKNSFNKNIWYYGAVQIHDETTPIPLIKSKPDFKYMNLLCEG